MQTICQQFPISNSEYEELNKEFGLLAHKAAWDLKRKNFNNNFIDDQEDVVQDLRIALINAGSYYKRQNYIEACFKKLKGHLKDTFICLILDELMDLWDNKTRHGAGKQKFGPYQEAILEKLTSKYVPETDRPNRYDTLVVDMEFKKYCKQVVWNKQRNLGKKITKEKSIRSGLCSLSDYDYLGGE